MLLALTPERSEKATGWVSRGASNAKSSPTALPNLEASCTFKWAGFASQLLLLMAQGRTQSAAQGRPGRGRTQRVKDRQTEDI